MTRSFLINSCIALSIGAAAAAVFMRPTPNEFDINGVMFELQAITNAALLMHESQGSHAGISIPALISKKHLDADDLTGRATGLIEDVEVSEVTDGSFDSTYAISIKTANLDACKYLGRNGIGLYDRAIVATVNERVVASTSQPGNERVTCKTLETTLTFFMSAELNYP